MACRQFEQLIALYIEGDLPRDETPRLESHLAGCQDCRQFAAELGESQQALSLYGAAEIDEAVYRGLRRDVMARVAAQRPSFWPRLWKLSFAWRLAAATAVLIAIAATALLVLMKNNSHKPASDNAQEIAGNTSRDNSRADKNQTDRGDTDGYTGGDTAGVDSKQQLVARKSVPASARRRMNAASERFEARAPATKIAAAKIPVAAVAERPIEEVVATILDSHAPAGPALSPTAIELTTPLAPAEPDIATKEEKTRMEIHTKDPNVRIIWLANKSSDHFSPS